MTKLGISERLACRVLGQHRSTQRKAPRGRADEAALTADIIALATQYGRYGYRRSCHRSAIDGVDGSCSRRRDAPQWGHR
jgi:hypothetical protein